MQNENNLPTNIATEILLQHPLSPLLPGKPTVTTHLLNYFSLLYILLRTLLALQITDEVLEAIVGVQGSNRRC